MHYLLLWMHELLQVLYRCLLQDVEDPSAWELVQLGSLYHWEGQEYGAIWGQTISGFVDEASNEFQVIM